MKLFAWQPIGHGQISLFVAAENKDKAEAAVNKYIDDHLNKDDGEYLSDYEIQGWGSDDYQLTELAPEQVITNSND